VNEYGAFVDQPGGSPSGSAVALAGRDNSSLAATVAIGNVSRAADRVGPGEDESLLMLAVKIA
jgi:hypothetical protein